MQIKRVWDPAVRIFHWSLAALFFVAYFTGEEEEMLHIYAGYGILALIVFRVIWGFIGSEHARFGKFIHGPATTWAYTRSLFSARPVHYLGHNPLGGWMIIALLATLILAGLSGLKVYGLEGGGPLAVKEVSESTAYSTIDNDDEALSARAGSGAWASARHDSDSDIAGESRIPAGLAEGAVHGDLEAHEAAEERWEEIHEVLANLALLLVAIHVAGVLIASAVHRENLIKAMVTGDKPMDARPPAEGDIGSLAGGAPHPNT